MPIEVLDFQWQMTAPANPGEDATFGTFEITTPAGVASPGLLSAVGDGRVLDHASSRGLAVYAAPLWWRQYHRDATHEGLDAYGRSLGKRWKDRANLIWVIGGDLRFRDADLPRFRALMRKAQ